MIGRVPFASPLGCQAIGPPEKRRDRVDMPAMIGWGAADPVTPLASGERLARETPGAELTTWPGLGHYPQLEDPAQVADAVAAFLRRADGLAAER